MPKLGEAFVNIRANLAPLAKGLKKARVKTNTAMSKISRRIGDVGFLVKEAWKKVSPSVKKAMDKSVGIVKSSMSKIIAVTKKTVSRVAFMFSGLKRIVMGATKVFGFITSIVGGVMRAATKIFGIIRSVVGRIVRLIKRAMIVVAAAIAGAIVSAVKFQTQLAMVSTMLTEKTMPAMQRFKSGMIDLAKKFGQSTATLAKGLFDILSASFSASEAMDLLTVSAKAAIAGQSDTATAVDTITGVLNAYGMSADKATEVSDKLFATVKRGKLVFGDLSNVIGMTGAMASIAGVSLDELLAIVATATRQNIKARQASFSVVAALQAFLKPQKEAAELAKKYGVELSVATLKTEGLFKAIGKLSKATTEELAIIIPTVRGFKSFAAAIKDSEGFATDLAQISVESAGKTEEAYKKMSETTGFKLKQLKQNLLAAAVAMGIPMLGPLEKLVEVFKSVFERIEKWAKNNGGIIERWADKVIGVIFDVIHWVDDLFSTFKQGGIGAALKSIIEDLKSAINFAFQIIKPHAIKVGEWIAEGFLKAIKIVKEKAKKTLIESPLALPAAGAAVGTAVAPGVGTAVGATVGAIGSGGVVITRESIGLIRTLRDWREATKEFIRLDMILAKRIEERIRVGPIGERINPVQERTMAIRERITTNTESPRESNIARQMRLKTDQDHISAIRDNTSALIRNEGTNREVSQ